MSDDFRCPDFEGAEYRRYKNVWAKTNAVLGGTKTMREAGETYLTKHTAESQECFNDRLDSSVLFNFSKEILEFWTSRPFASLVKLNNTTPEFEKMAEDIDRKKNNLSVFCRGVFNKGLAKNIAYVLVDAPKYSGERTLADVKSTDRPYWVNIPAENVIFKRYDDDDQLNYVAIRETKMIQQGFGEISMEVIKIWTPGLVETYWYDEEKKATEECDKWVLLSQETYDLDQVPIVEFYATEDSTTPLENIVELNVTHWSSYSDQRNILKVTRFPMLASSGTADSNDNLKVGPNVHLFTSSEKGKFYYVEHQGHSVEHGRNDLKDLEEQMKQYASEFLKKRPDRETATSRKMDSVESTSPLQDTVLRFNEFINKLIRLTEKWLDAEDGSYGTVFINHKFSSGFASEADMQILLQLVIAGHLKASQLVGEMKNRGSLSEEFDVTSIVDEPPTPAPGVSPGQNNLDREDRNV